MKIPFTGRTPVPIAIGLLALACARPPIPKNPTWEQLEQGLKLAESILKGDYSDEVKKAAKEAIEEIKEAKSEFR